MAAILISRIAVRCVFSFNWVFHVSGHGECSVFSRTTFAVICTLSILLPPRDIVPVTALGPPFPAKRQKEKKSLHKFSHFITCWLQFTPIIFTGVIILFTFCLVQTCPQCIRLPGNLSVSLILNISFWFLNNPPNSLCCVFIGLLVPLLGSSYL